MAINKNDFKNAEGNYEAKNTLMDAVIDGVNGNEAQLTNLGPNVGTLDANSPGWRNVEGVGFYYFGSGGEGRGYPANYGYVLHIRYPSASIMLQVYIASSGRLWTRLITASDLPDFRAV